MCRLRRCCVSFVLALLLSSVSLVPCFASSNTVTGSDFIVNTDDTLCTVRGFVNLLGGAFEFPVPVNELMIWDTGYDSTASGPFPIVPCFTNLSSFILTEDVTLYWRVAPFVYTDDGPTPYGISDLDNINTYLPSFYYGAGYNGPSTEDAPTHKGTVTALAMGDASFGSQYSRAYRATLPAKTPAGNFTENFSIYYPGFDENDTVLGSGDSAHWNTGGISGSVMLHVDLFQVVHTTNSEILDTLDRILDETWGVGQKINNVIAALDRIIVQFGMLNADTYTIIEMLEVLTSLSDSQLTQLHNISSSVDAIYYFLTQELKSESEELSGEAASIGGAIENNQYAEEYYQTSMQSSYDSLDLENFSFAGLSGAMQLVGTVFSDMWSAFGEYTILFTYPLVLGIALLVIGRISKHGGGNSSRDSEHNGGEGGA